MIEVSRLRTGMRAALASALLSCAPAPGVLAEALPTGPALYLKECSGCHGKLPGSSGTAGSPTALRVASTQSMTLTFALPYGPSLAGIHGRRAGSVPGYDYSKAFLRSMEGVVWSTVSLDEYLTDTQVRAPGARMYYAQPDAAIRRRIIEYLATTEAH